MLQLLAWLESTGLARIVGGSLPLTAALSAIHAIGFTLVMSGGMLWNLYAAGALFSAEPPASIARPATRLLISGLAVSLVTGIALFAPRASYTGPSNIFQLKLALIFTATIFQLVVNILVVRRPLTRPASLRVNGILGTMLWLALAVTACWFILFE